MATFIGQLIGFAVIVLVIVKFVVPPVRSLMAARQDEVRSQLEESAQAAQRIIDADQYLAERIADGRSEAAVIVGEATSDAQRIAEQLRAQAAIDAERIRAQGDQQVALLRSQKVRELRSDLGREAVHKASTLIHSRLAEPHEVAATVDRFLDEIESMAAVTTVGRAGAGDLRPASREARIVIINQFDSAASALSTDQLTAVASDLAAVAGLLQREPMLARHLADGSGDSSAKTALMERVLSGKVEQPTLEILRAGVSARWSATSDLVDSIQLVAQLSLLERARRQDQVEAVAEELFRCSRLLAGQPRLSSLLSDSSESPDGRVTLLESVLGEGSGNTAITVSLLAQSVRLLHGQRLEDVIEDLAHLAIARQGEIVAEVIAAASISEGQMQRLRSVLARIYRHAVSVQLTIDKSVLGGLSVTVGEDVIDGTISSRLAAAASHLPD
jgi:F-type H+-transporting ATPase subunit delta